MIGLTLGINSVSNVWRSSSLGLSCFLCPVESRHGVPSEQPRRCRGFHRHEDLPIPTPHPAALYTQSDPSDELNPEENGKPGLHADLDQPFGHTCYGNRPASALAGTSKRCC